MQLPIRASRTSDEERGSSPAAGRRRVLRRLLVPLLVAAIATAAAPGWSLYRIRQGDTLTDIAKRYHTSISRLVAANRLPGNGNLIIAGELLRVPVPARARASAPRPGTVTTRTVVLHHRVVQGDSVIKIAKAYGVVPRAIVAANHLRSSRIIRLGAVLRIPKTTRVVVRARSSANTFAGRMYPPAVVAAANRHRAALARQPRLSRAYVKSLIVRTAKANRLDPSLALAVAWQESGFNARVVSVADAIGVMQVLPSTGAWASGVVGRHLNLLRVKDNVLAGVVLLKVLTKNASTVQNAIAGYYQGLASVGRNGMFADTKRYVANVMLLRKHFS